MAMEATQPYRRNPLLDEAEIRRASALLLDPDQVFEVRILKASLSSNGQYTATYGGYFNNVESMLSHLRKVQSAKGIYITLQACKPNLIHRTYNELVKQEQGNSTADGDITGYRWLLIDSDPDRDPTNISATNEEHDEALRHSQRIADALSEQGWPKPLIADSGNGGHLLYRIDLLPEDKGLVERTLKGLGKRFDLPSVHVDQTVFNPARICKLYGTLVCKGANTPLRPHRMSKLLSVPDDITVVQRSLLEAVAIPATTTIPAHPLCEGITESFTAEDFIQRHHIDTYPPQAYAGGTRWQLRTCVWNADHTDHSACIYQFADGRLGASCSHNSCHGRGWKDFRLTFEPDAYTRKLALVPTKSKKNTAIKQETQRNVKEDILCRFSADDAGNGEAMHALFGREFLYSEAVGWMYYTGTHWEVDESTAHIVRCAIDTLRARRHSAVDADKENIIKVTTSDVKRINGTITCFRSMVSTRIDVFDREEHLINCKNGVVNLKTGELTAHDNSQRFTYCVPFEYRETDVSVWTDYLGGVVGGGQEMVDYLQLALGYSITGSTREECLFYVCGPSRSGKGTLSDSFTALLPRPLSTMVDFNSFTAKREGDVSNFDLAELKPSRLVFASESQRNQSLNPAKIKQLTGGDLVRACFKHKSHFTYRPQFKVWMFSNWPVNGDPEDDALWGRVRVISFPNSYLGKEDKTKKETLKSEESLTALLYWTVQGAIKWYALGARGLHTPALVAEATKGQRDAQDYVQQWINERCETEAGTWTSNEDITKSYTAWCEVNSVTPKKAKALAQSLQIKGYETGVVKRIGSFTQKGVRGIKIACSFGWDEPEENVTDRLRVTDVTASSDFLPKLQREDEFPISPVTSVTDHQSVTFFLEGEKTEGIIDSSASPESENTKNTEVIEVLIEDRALYGTVATKITQEHRSTIVYKDGYTYGQFLDSIGAIVSVDTVAASTLSWARSELKAMLSPQA